jgi:hypothetical protein
VADDTAALLEKWSKDTGKSLSELMTVALTLLQYSVEDETKLIRENQQGEKVQLKV